MASLEILLLLLGGFVGGVVNGLSGFGLALAALPIWLFALPPQQAATMAAGCAAIGQMQTIRAILPAVRWRQVVPMIVYGLIGLPIGVAALPHIPLSTFKMALGGFLILYAVVMMLAAGRFRLIDRSPLGDGVSGFLGGVMAGLAGVSGAVPTMWAALQSWSRDEKRAMLQSFNFVVLLTTFTVNAAMGAVDRDMLVKMALTLPAVFAGVYLGHWLYKRLDDRRFDRVVLMLLMASGLVLIIAGA